MAGSHGMNGTANESEQRATGCREMSMSVVITNRIIIINKAHAQIIDFRK